MKLTDLFEYKNRYEKGDTVNTAMGKGKITDVKQAGEQNEHVMVHPDKAAQKKFELEDRPYKMGYGEIKSHG